MRALVGIGLAAVMALASGCSFKECTDEYVVPSYRITVADATTGDLICDADVTVNGGAARRSQVDCSYVLEIPTNDISATVAAAKDGYEPHSEQVSTAYDEDDCGHAIARRVKLALTPQ